MSGKRWEQSEIMFLRNNEDMTNAEIAKFLGRSRYAVQDKKRDLNLCKTNLDMVMPEVLSPYEKESRIIKMAADMRVRLLG